MVTKAVGIGEWIVSNDPREVVKTFALGSCVAVLIYDVRLRIGGMIHIALPDSSIDPGRAAAQPGYFANTGLPLMIEAMKRLGAGKPHVWVKMAGGASVMDPIGLFDIGKRNVLAVKRELWRSSLGLSGDDTGGEISRTVTLSIADGEATISSSNRVWKL
ncbi:MAG TPA: chemotaxis protein CheD [Magnetospirillaceae bacterium]|nr:chemotaxis protein CheD [Magnetospirillaceae bacterium]